MEKNGSPSKRPDNLSKQQKENAQRLPSWWKDCRMLHQGLNIQQSKQWKRLRAPRSCIREDWLSQSTRQDEEFFPVCCSTPNGKSVGKHGRCPVFPNGVWALSSFRNGPQTNCILGTMNDESKKTYWEQSFPCSRFSICIYFGQIDLFSTWSFLSA